MKYKFIVSIMAVAGLIMSCDPEYPTPTPASSHDPVTGKPLVFPKANILAVHASPNAGTTISLLSDNVAITGAALTFGQKFPGTGVYSNAVFAGSRQLRVTSGGTSLLSTRPFLNGNTNSSFFVIGRSGVTLSSRADRLRLIEILNESLPSVPTGTPNTAHVRFYNFGLLQTAAAPGSPATGTTLGGISLKIDLLSPVATSPAGGFFLGTTATFPASAGNTRAYAATTATFTAFTVPAVGAAGNDYLLDVVNATTGAVILDDISLKLVAGKIYTIIMVGSSDAAEAPYQLLVITHR